MKNITINSHKNGGLPNSLVSSCTAPYPLDTNKCHAYSCNEATGQYTLSIKKCGANEDCEETTGTCASTCKTYSGIGTFTIKPCDVIKGDQFTLFVDNVTYNNFGKDGRVHLTARYDNNGRKLEEHVSAPVGDAPIWMNTLNSYGNQMNRLAIHGGYVRVAPSSKLFDIKQPEATLIVEPECTPLFNECMANLAKNGEPKPPLPETPNFTWVTGWGCQFICPATPTLPQQTYSATKDIRLRMPPGYTKAAAAIAQLAQNCYNRLVNLFGIEASHPIFMSYAVSNSTSCSFGADEQYKLDCFVTPKYSDATIEKIPKYAALLSGIAAGQCSGFFDQFDEVIDDALPHELAHNFAMATFASANNEGFATFSEHKIADIGAGYMLKLECYSTGYAFSTTGNSNSGPSHPYTPWTSSNYFGGACLLQEFQKLYGDKILQAAFQIFHKLPKEKNFNLFKDVFNTAAQDDFFTKSKGIHKLTTDPVFSSGSTQYFFSSP